jgi:hypothetical protein
MAKKKKEDSAIVISVGVQKVKNPKLFLKKLKQRKERKNGR